MLLGLQSEREWLLAAGCVLTTATYLHHAGFLRFFTVLATILVVFRALAFTRYVCALVAILVSHFITPCFAVVDVAVHPKRRVPVPA